MSFGNNLKKQLQKMNIEHQRFKQNWLKPTDISKPKTLILGSFNPYNPNDEKKLVDYYYGRKSNNFWKSIALINGKPIDYFFDSNYHLKRKIEIMQNSFCCLDIINSIDFKCSNDKILKEYIEKDIFKNFSDKKIWCKNNRINKINLTRNYNIEVIEFLRDSITIKTVIHTMGLNRINSKNGTNPKEKSLEEDGFKGYFSQIINVCKEKSIEIIFDCPSPSGYLKSNVNINMLIEFYTKYILNQSTL